MTLNATSVFWGSYIAGSVSVYGLKVLGTVCSRRSPLCSRSDIRRDCIHFGRRDQSDAEERQCIRPVGQSASNSVE